MKDYSGIEFKGSRTSAGSDHADEDDSFSLSLRNSSSVRSAAAELARPESKGSESKKNNILEKQQGCQVDMPPSTQKLIEHRTECSVSMLEDRRDDPSSELPKQGTVSARSQLFESRNIEQRVKEPEEYLYALDVQESSSSSSIEISVDSGNVEEGGHQHHRSVSYSPFQYLNAAVLDQLDDMPDDEREDSRSSLQVSSNSQSHGSGGDVQKCSRNDGHPPQESRFSLNQGIDCISSSSTHEDDSDDIVFMSIQPSSDISMGHRKPEMEETVRIRSTRVAPAGESSSGPQDLSKGNGEPTVLQSKSSIGDDSIYSMADMPNMLGQSQEIKEEGIPSWHSTDVKDDHDPAPALGDVLSSLSEGSDNEHDDHDGSVTDSFTEDDDDLGYSPHHDSAPALQTYRSPRAMELKRTLRGIELSSSHVRRKVAEIQATPSEYNGVDYGDDDDDEAVNLLSESGYDEHRSHEDLYSAADLPSREFDPVSVGIIDRLLPDNDDGHESNSKAPIKTKAVPSWRISPEDHSYSDFAVTAKVVQTNETHKYHIHKHIVSMGPSRSIYLHDIFREQRDVSSCTVLLKQASADLMPVFLDFLYGSEEALLLTSENAVPMRNLAVSFKVASLLDQVESYILSDMDQSTLATYADMGASYHDDWVINLVVKRCAKDIEAIEIWHEIWKVVEPDFFYSIISSPKIDREKSSHYLSVLVVRYYSMHRTELTDDLFARLCSASIIPLIHRDATLKLLEITVDCEEIGLFESLQRRCLQVVACYWKEMPEDDRKHLFSLLRHLPSSFTVDFLELVEAGKTSTLVNSFQIPENGIASNNSKSFEDLSESRQSLSVKSDRSSSSGDLSWKDEASKYSDLSWKLSPHDSFSDCTLIVRSSKYINGQEYHVHRELISYGTKKSSLLRNMLISEQQSAPAQINVEIGHAAAVLMPHVLDFIYSRDDKLSIITENAVGLRYLARYLGINKLNETVLNFVSEDISIDKLYTYVEDSYIFQDQEILQLAVDYLAKNIRQVELGSGADRFDPTFFLRVLHSDQLEQSDNCHVVTLVFEYHSAHNLSEETLNKLLGECIVPKVTPETTVPYLKTLSLFNTSGYPLLEEIREQCIACLGEHWMDLRDEYREDVFAIILPKLESGLLSVLFDQVEGSYHDRHEQAMLRQSRTVNHYQKEMAEMRAAHDQKILDLNQKMESTIAELESKQRSLEAQLARYAAASQRRSGWSSGSAFGSRIPTSPRATATCPRKTPTNNETSPVARHHPSGIPSPKTTKACWSCTHQGVPQTTTSPKSITRRQDTRSINDEPDEEGQFKDENHDKAPKAAFSTSNESESVADGKKEEESFTQRLAKSLSFT